MAIIHTTAATGTGPNVQLQREGNAMFAAYMTGGVGSATVLIKGAADPAQPASTHKTLGTLSPTGTTADEFKINGEKWAHVYAVVSAVSGGTVAVTMME